VARAPTLPDTDYNLAIRPLASGLPGVDTIDRYKQAIAYFTTYKEKGGTDERVDQYLKDAAKGIDREQRRREREKKDQLRKAQQAEKDAAAAQKPADASADAQNASPPPATETSAPPPSHGRLPQQRPCPAPSPPWCSWPSSGQRSPPVRCTPRAPRAPPVPPLRPRRPPPPPRPGPAR